MEPRRILRYLPENYQLAAADQHGVLVAMLAVMDSMHAPAERVLDSLDSYFDPYRAPDAFVLMQASWFGLDRYFEWSGRSPGNGEPKFAAGIDRLRNLIAEFPELARSRGTHRALTRFLEVATGSTGFAVDDATSTGEDFHLIVHAPISTAPLESLMRKIIAGERPAHATWDLRFEDDHQKE
jgi:phage tail-like protein